MNTKWHLFKIMGHSVIMTPSFLIVMLVFSLLNVDSLPQLIQGLFWIPVLFLGILWHELGHATMSKALGHGTSQIMFWGLGGLAINARRGGRKPKHDLLISLAGPLASLVLALASGAAWYAIEGGFAATTYLGGFLRLMTLANAFWVVFNMLPVHPMDGGQALLNVFRMALKQEAKAIRVTAYASLAGIVAGLGLYALAFGRAPGMMILFLAAYFGYMNVSMLRSGREQSLLAG